MKKILLSVLMLVTVLFVLSSCSAKKTETVAELNLKLSDNLPGFNMKGHYTEAKSNIELNPDAEIKMQEFPNIEIYLDDGDFEFTAENIAKKWKVDNVEVLEHEFKSNDQKTKIPGYRISCEYTKNGKTMVCRDDLVKTGDKFFAMEFSYDKSITFPEYVENSYRAFLYTIVEK